MKRRITKLGDSLQTSKAQTLIQHFICFKQNSYCDNEVLVYLKMLHYHHGTSTFETLTKEYNMCASPLARKPEGAIKVMAQPPC